MPLPVDMEKRYVTEVKKGSGGNKMEEVLSKYAKALIYEALEEMAKKMLADGLDVSAISRYTGLSEAQINSMRRGRRKTQPSLPGSL